ncbi:translation initiation factor 2 subunit 2 [Pancytospora epiphaga]|nr:translation initiation factor 2 subunit 2 [Pancytospora epiphaga]
MTSSTSSEEDFLPVGISMLNIHSSRKSPAVMAKKMDDDSSGLIPPLRYINLLNTAMEILNKAQRDDEEKIKLPLNVIRKSRKTYINVVDIGKKLYRQPEHLSHFVAKELYTEGSINKEGCLVLNGSFLQSNIERALRHFIEIFVVCKSCDSVEDTYITREAKLFFLKCERCKASRCVGNNIEGYTLKDKANPKLRGIL